MKFIGNRNDKNIMQTFADSSLTMDEKFKAKLKKQVITHDKQLKGSKRGFAWPKFILAPALLFALVAVGGLLLFNNGGDPKSPLTPRFVSAEEVLNRSRDYYKTFDISKYNFRISSQQTIIGPKNNCSEFRGMGNGNSTFASYTFWSKNSRAEALYTRIERPDAELEKMSEESFYSNDSVVLRENYTKQRTNDLPPVAEGLSSAGQSVYVFVDKNGNKLASEDLKVTQRNGRDVYVFYMLYNKGVLSSYCENEIIEAVFDAETYANLEFNTYQGVISPDQLIISSIKSETFQDISEAEALRIMTEAGFDKQKAPLTLKFVPIL